MTRRPVVFARTAVGVSMAAIAFAGTIALRFELGSVLLLGVMTWATVASAVDAWFGRPASGVQPADQPGTLTVFIHVAGGPAHQSFTAVRAASLVAPTVVIATDHGRVAAMTPSGPLGASVSVGATVAEAVNQAVRTVETDAVVFLSATSFLDVRSATGAAGLVRDGAGWAIGRARTFNRDGFAVSVRSGLMSSLRSSARAAGLHLWEPDATVVSAELLRDRPLALHRPWGAWLRACASAGAVGVEFDGTVAVTAEPVDARSFWPTSVARRRGSVADIADAVVTARGRRRALAVGLLLRELDGVRLTLWLVMPWLLARTGRLPFSTASWTVAAAVVGSGLLRWLAERWSHQVKLHPMSDALALAYDAPGSILALPAMFSRRVRTTRLPVPNQPLALAGCCFAVVAFLPLLRGGATATRIEIIGLVVSELAVLWLVALRALFQRNWARMTYRVKARLPAKVDSVPAWTRDVSPTAVAVEGDLAAISNGAVVPVTVTLSSGVELDASASVAGKRVHGATTILGLVLDLPSERAADWIALVSQSAVEADHRPDLLRPSTSPTDGARKGWVLRLVTVVATVVTVVLSVLGLSAAMLAASGTRPLVVRSGSMEPALAVGDVVVVEDVDVSDLERGDISAIDDPALDEIRTHRVESVQVDIGAVVVTTRGDANVSHETVVMAPKSIVGRVVLRIPKIGAVMTTMGEPRARVTAAAIGVALLVLSISRPSPRRARRGRRPEPGESLSPASTSTSTSTSPSAPAASTAVSRHTGE